MSLWSLRQRPSARLRISLELSGAALLIAVWWLVGAFFALPKTLLPMPGDVLAAFPALLAGTNVPMTSLQLAYPWLPYAHTKGIVWHAVSSILLNVTSYAVAIGIAVPVGFAIGLFGPIRAMLERELTGFRYAPITAFIGVFIAWFGLSFGVKTAFLAFGVLVYLIPQVVQRVDEVEGVYVDTAKTCGATRWQHIRTVFWPLCIARLSDDCRTIVPITWTYLIIAEGFNLSEGGLGAHAMARTRTGQWDYVFALVVIILTIGFCMDKCWLAADRRIWRWKHV